MAARRPCVSWRSMPADSALTPSSKLVRVRVAAGMVLATIDEIIVTQHSRGMTTRPQPCPPEQQKLGRVLQQEAGGRSAWRRRRRCLPTTRPCRQRKQQRHCCSHSRLHALAPPPVTPAGTGCGLKGSACAARRWRQGAQGRQGANVAATAMSRAYNYVPLLVGRRAIAFRRASQSLAACSGPVGCAATVVAMLQNLFAS